MAAESPTGITPPYGSHLTCILTPDVDSQVFFNRKLFATIFPSIKLRWIFFLSNFEAFREAAGSTPQTAPSVQAFFFLLFLAGKKVIKQTGAYQEN